MESVYQFSIVRYVPSIVRDEAVNVGVLVRARDGSEFDFKFLPRTATVRKLWPDADTQVVTQFERQLRKAAKGEIVLQRIGNPSSDGFFSRAREEFTGNLQLTEPRSYLADSLIEVVQHTYKIYIAEPKGGARPINYQALAPITTRQRLWAAFEKRGLVHRGGVEEKKVLAGKHAPWTFDLAYKNGKLNLINSLALDAPTSETTLGRALVLKGMLEDVRESENTDIHGVAVASLPKTGDRTAAKRAERLLTDADIDVFDSTALPELVEKVAAELGD
jgi:hypothetical protein